MAFADYIARAEGELAFFAYVYVGGLGPVFSNVPQPAEWTDLGAGRTWSRTFTYFRPGGGRGLDSTLDVIESEVDYDTAVVSSGQMTLEFQIDPEAGTGGWIDLLLPSASAGLPINITRRALDLDPTSDTLGRRVIRPGDDTLVVLQTAGIAVGEVWHMGAEAVSILAVDAPTRTLKVERGYFGSARGWYGVPTGSTRTLLGGLPEMTDWPETLRGRNVEVWLEACWVDAAGAVRPLSSAPKGDHSRQMFRGVVWDHSWGDDYSSLRLVCHSIMQALDRPVLTRQRVYRVGPHFSALGHGSVWVDPDGLHLVEYHGGSRGAQGNGIVDVTTVSSPIDWTGGRLTYASELLQTVADELGGKFNNGAGDRYVFQSRLVEADGGLFAELRTQKWNGVALVNIEDELTLKLGSANDPAHSVLGALGLPPGQDFVLPPTTRWIRFPEPLPDYTIGRTSSRIYYTGPSAVDLFDDPPRGQGITGAEGNFLRVDKSHVIEGRFRDPETGAVLTDGSDTYLEVLNSSACATRAPMSYTCRSSALEDDQADQPGNLYLGLGVERGVDLLLALRVLACSSGDDRFPVHPTNLLPEGFGAGLDPTATFDHESFDRCSEAVGAVSGGWFLEAKATLRELFELIGLAYGIGFVPRSTSRYPDNGYVIAAVLVDPVPLGTTPDYTVDDDWTKSTSEAPVPDRSERRVRNQLVFEYSWSPTERKFLVTDNSFRHAASMQKYGPSEPLRVRLPWLHELGDVRLALERVAMGVFARYASPVCTIEVPVYRPEVWNVDHEDLIALTHPFLPDYRQGGIGLSAELTQVQRIERHLSPGSETWGKLTLLWRAASNYRYAAYVPCLAVLENTTGTTYLVAQDEGEGGFSDPADSRKDIDHYALAATQGWWVRISDEGADSSYVIRQVTAVDVAAHTITLTGPAVTIGTRTIVEFAADDDVGVTLADGQREHVFFADDLLLTVDDGVISYSRDGNRWA